MPQMMPINWMLHFLFFICIFIMFNILNYYILNNKNFKDMNYQSKNKKMNNLIWKW